MSRCHPAVWVSPFLAALLLLLSHPSHAADAPILSMKRVSFATGLDHRWQPDRVSSWAVGAFGAYNLTPHASIVGSSLYDLKSERMEHRIGVRLRIFQGSK